MRRSWWWRRSLSSRGRSSGGVPAKVACRGRAGGGPSPARSRLRPGRRRGLRHRPAGRRAQCHDIGGHGGPDRDRGLPRSQNPDGLARAHHPRGGPAAGFAAAPGNGGGGSVDRLLVLSQLVLGLALPFVLVPMLLLLADRRVMQRLPLGRRSLGLAGSLVLLLIGLNLWLVV